MAKRLHNTLKRLYPMNEICRLIDEHFAGIHGLERLLLDVQASVEAVGRSAAGGLGLPQGMTSAVQQTPQQQICQELEQNLVLSRKAASAIESVNASLLEVVTQRDERDVQLASALEQLNDIRGLTSGLAERVATLQTLHNNEGLAESRTLQEFARLSGQLAELADVLREFDRWHSSQMKQIFDCQSLAESRTLEEVARIKEQLTELDRKHSSQMQQILDRLIDMPPARLHGRSRSEPRPHRMHSRGKS